MPNDIDLDVDATSHIVQNLSIITDQSTPSPPDVGNPEFNASAAMMAWFNKSTERLAKANEVDKSYAEALGYSVLTMLTADAEAGGLVGEWQTQP